MHKLAKKRAGCTAIKALSMVIACIFFINQLVFAFPESPTLRAISSSHAAIVPQLETDLKTSSAGLTSEQITKIFDTDWSKKDIDNANDVGEMAGLVEALVKSGALAAFPNAEWKFMLFSAAPGTGKDYVHVLNGLRSSNVKELAAFKNWLEQHSIDIPNFLIISDKLSQGILTDAEIESLSASEMAIILRASDLSDYNLEEKFLLYSGAPGSGKGSLMESSFGKMGPYSNIASQLLLYHTRNARTGELDGVKYHFGNESVGESHNRLALRENEGHIKTTYVNKQLQGIAFKEFEEEVLIRPGVDSERLLPGDIVIEVNGVKVDPFTIEVTEPIEPDATTKVIRKIQGLAEAFQSSKITVLEGGYGWFQEISKEAPNVFTVFLSPFSREQVELRGVNQRIIDENYSEPFQRFIAYSQLNIMRKKGMLEKLDLRDSQTLNELKSAVTRWFGNLDSLQESKAVEALGRNSAEPLDALVSNAKLIESPKFIEETNHLLGPAYFNHPQLRIDSNNIHIAKAIAYEVQMKLARDIKRGDVAFKLEVSDRITEKKADFSKSEDMFNRVIEGVIQVMCMEEYARDGGKGAIVLNPFVYNPDDVTQALTKVTDDFSKEYFSYLLKAINEEEKNKHADYKSSSSGAGIDGLSDYDAEKLLADTLLNYAYTGTPAGITEINKESQAIVVYSDSLQQSPALQNVIRNSAGDSRKFYLVNKEEGISADAFLQSLNIDKAVFQRHVFNQNSLSADQLALNIAGFLHTNNIKQGRVFAGTEADISAWSKQGLIEALVMLLKDKRFEIISDYSQQHIEYIKTYHQALIAA